MSTNGNASILSGGTGGVSKVTPQASIIINSAIDAYDVALRMHRKANETIYPSIAEENFALMRGELVFAKRGARQGGAVQQSGKNNPSVTVASSVNGLSLENEISADVFRNERDPRKRRRYLRRLEKNMWMVGVAQGEKSKRDFENRSLSLAVRVSGSDTIFNTGNDTILPGDTVVWELPDPAEGAKTFTRNGQPKLKNVLTVRKYNYNIDQVKSDLQEIREGASKGDSKSDEFLMDKKLGELCDAVVAVLQLDRSKAKELKSAFTSNAPTPSQDALAEFLQFMIQYKREHYDSKVIGKALSQGDPGQHFDILLHHSHSTA